MTWWGWLLWAALAALAVGFPIYVAVQLRIHFTADMERLGHEVAKKVGGVEADLDGKVVRTRADCAARAEKVERAVRDELAAVSGAVWYKVCRRDPGHMPAQDARVMEALKEMSSPPEPTEAWRAAFRAVLVARGLRPSLVPRPGQKPACAVCGEPCDTVAVEPIA